MEENQKSEVLLKVDHLCQYFKMGPGQELRAVDDVSFEVRKGEVFGLVGESGCGKTTTGRSIIKLYDITSGSVYFKGYRICAGTRAFRDKIAQAKAEYKQFVKENKDSCTEEQLAEKKAELKKVIAEQKALIKEAKDDHKNCEKKYLELLKTEYAQAVSEAGGAENLTEEQKTKYRTVENLPKVPKKVWLSVGYSLLAAALILIVLAIVFFAQFTSKYGSYMKQNAEIIAVDEENRTTTVKYIVDYQEYTAVVSFYDPELVPEEGGVTLRLTIYYNKDKPEQVALEKPSSPVSTALAITAAVAGVAGVVILVYVNERYNPAKLITQIQMIFQDPIASLNPRMTVKDIISEGLVIGGERDKKYIEEEVYKVLDLVGLVPEHAGRYPHEFSGGQRQRIGVARSVIMKPELIIADEPISALDVSIQAQVINLLNDLRDKLGLTILFIAHDLSVVKYFSDRIGVMYYGKMVEMAPSDELFAHPLHPYTRALLSAIPLPDPEFEKNRKRIVYNPIAEHDYSVDKPTFREVSPEHFVYCNDAEFEKYTEQLKA